MNPRLSSWREQLAALTLEPCIPPFWAKGPHAQTILGNYLHPQKNPDAHAAVEVPVSDGDKLLAQFYPTDGADTVVYLFHGLAGNAEGSYMARQIRLGRSRGRHVYAVNHRGCGLGRGLARHPYHSGRAEDLAAVIREGRKRHPDALHVAVGFSLSGNALLLLAAGVRANDKPDLAIAVNAPIFLEEAALNLKRGFCKVYDWRFSLKLRREVYKRRKDGLLDRDYQIPLINSLHDFDNQYTAPAGGFEHREDYYASCSAGPHLHKIDIPTVLLTSRDDPMVPVSGYLRTEHSPCIHFHLEDKGGHMGYLHHRDTDVGDRRWLDHALDLWLERSRHVLHPRLAAGTGVG